MEGFFILITHLQAEKNLIYHILLNVPSLPTCFALGSSTQCFSWHSCLRVCLHMLLYNSPSPPTNTCTCIFCSPYLYSLFHFHFLSFTVLHSDSFQHQVRLCYSLILGPATQKSAEKLTPRCRHPNEIKQSFPPGSMSHFLARQYMAILPPCN